MKTVTISKMHRRRKNRKTARIFASLVFMAFSAYFITLSSQGKKSITNLLKDTGKSIGRTVCMNTMENCSPVMEYGMYSKIGLKSLNWEAALIGGGVSKNSDMQKLVAATNAAKENQTAVQASLAEKELVIDKNSDVGEVEVLEDDTYFEPDDEGMKSEAVETGAESANAIAQNKAIISQLKKSKSTNYLVKNFFIVDSSTRINDSVFNVEKLLNTDCTMKKRASRPQILIYHTHGGSEEFVNSRQGKESDSVVGVGTTLEKLLSEKYGFNVIHDKTCYDVINGKIDRSKAYDKALNGVTKILKKNPTIQVCIDLHRDNASQGKKRAAMVNGKSTAQIMFFNGLSRNANGEISYLKNSNLQGNLAFSLKMKMKAMELYPNLTTKIYLKQYRYNLHLRKKSLLIELGTNLNTVAEAKNAMEPLAEVLKQVLNED